ncbi:MAG: sugar ABC transporter ATP-binding protein [Chloroflexi bacterium]|nr:MAG: sugar ABC transporter ATP-binding protein [Chloroflexota bacterium]
MAEQTLSTRTLGPQRVATERPSIFRTQRFQENFTRVVATILCTIGLVVVLFPAYWMFSTSLKGQIEAFKSPPVWIPTTLHWENYYDALIGTNPFPRYFLNSFYFATMVVIAEVVANSFIAFGFARLRAPGRNTIFIMVLATLMIPGEVTLIPQYVLFSRLGWLNSYKPLIIPAWFGSAYLIFLLRQFYMTIPKEYDEAAIIEGAGWLTIWSRIILPLSKSALGVVAIMSFIFHWNFYQGPLIYLNDNNLFTVSLGLSMFRTPFGGTPWHWYMAAAFTSLLPCIVLFFVAQRYFIQGIVVSGVKG